MKKSLPELPTRSLSPSKFIIKPSKLMSNLTPSSFKSRKSSNSPLRKISNDSLCGIRTVSDEVLSLQSSKSSKKSIFGKLSPMLADLDNKYFRENLKPSNLKTKEKMYFDIINALFSLCHANDTECTAVAASSLFLALDYSADYESLALMFKGSFDQNSISLVSFSKYQLLKICQDPKVDNRLKLLLQAFKDSKMTDRSEFDSMVACIKKWWNRLDLSKTGFVSTAEVIDFLITLNIFENSVQVRKSFTKMSIFINYSQFFSLFAKGLLKFLILSLCDDAADRGSVSADIVINAKRRKIIIQGLNRGSKILESRLHYHRLN